jgi:hypothetical protein
VWISTTFVALAFILQGKVQQHRQWMTRSFACALIFLEVRVIEGLTKWNRFSEIIVWSCVVAAVPLADFLASAGTLPHTRDSRQGWPNLRRRPFEESRIR